MRRVLLAVVIASACGAAAAWESDVHYGLTYWLAREAGAKEDAARAIANGNQLADTGIFDAVHLMMRYACLGSAEVTASIDVRERHFATFENVPGAPAKREVKAGSEAAWQGVKERLQAPSSNLPNEIEKFGLALHRLQDSWSHQGVPEIPQKFGVHICDENVGWAHPKSRHGWASHNADLTYLWEKDTAETAKATYEALVKFIDLHKEIRQRQATPLAQVMAEIPEFQKARTKTQKRAWFTRQQVAGWSFLDSTSLPDGDQRFAQRSLTLTVTVPQVPKPPAGVAAEVTQFFAGFFQDWAVTDNFAATVEKHMDVQTARSAMALTTDSPNQARQQLAQTLRMWRILDHGRVAATGHRPFSAGTSVSATVAAVLSDLPVARYENTAQAFSTLRQSGGNQTFAIFSVPSKDNLERYVAAARFRHAPNDTVIVTAQKLQNGYRVVAIDSMVEH